MTHTRIWPPIQVQERMANMRDMMRHISETWKVPRGSIDYKTQQIKEEEDEEDEDENDEEDVDDNDNGDDDDDVDEDDIVSNRVHLKCHILNGSIEGLIVPTLIINLPTTKGSSSIQSPVTRKLLKQHLRHMVELCQQYGWSIETNQTRHVFRIRTLKGGRDLAAVSRTRDLQAFIRQRFDNQGRRVRHTRAHTLHYARV